jgi:predicted nucleic-acid-binding Zn-ribbon protein
MKPEKSYQPCPKCGCTDFYRNRAGFVFCDENNHYVADEAELLPEWPEGLRGPDPRKLVHAAPQAQPEPPITSRCKCGEIVQVAEKWHWANAFRCLKCGREWREDNQNAAGWKADWSRRHPEAIMHREDKPSIPDRLMGIDE